MPSVKKKPSQKIESPANQQARSHGTASIPFARLSSSELRSFLEKFPEQKAAIQETLTGQLPQEIEQARHIGAANPEQGALAFQKIALNNLRGEIIPQSLPVAINMALEALKLSPRYGATTLTQLAKTYARGEHGVKKDDKKALSFILKAAIINPEAAGHTLRELKADIKIKDLSQDALEEYGFTLENHCKHTPLGTLPGFDAFFENFMETHMPDIYPEDTEARVKLLEKNHRPDVMGIIQDLETYL